MPTTQPRTVRNLVHSARSSCANPSRPRADWERYGVHGARSSRLPATAAYGRRRPRGTRPRPGSAPCRPPPASPGAPTPRRTAPPASLSSATIRSGRQPGDGRACRGRWRRRWRPRWPAPSSPPAARGAQRRPGRRTRPRSGRRRWCRRSTLPRPTTTRWSAVSCSSLIRWLDTSTARPCGGQRPQEAAHPHDALRVQAVERLVQHQHRRVAEQRRRDAEPLPHAERVAAGLAAGRRPPGRPARSPRRPAGPVRPCECASHSRWLRALRLGCSAAASSSEPTWLQRVPQARGRAGRRSARCPRRPRRGRGSPASWWTCPAPFGPDEAGDLPRLDGEGHPVQRRRRPEPLAQAGDFDGCFHAGKARESRGPPGRHAAEPSSPSPARGTARGRSLARGMPIVLARRDAPACTGGDNEYAWPTSG